VTWANGKSKLVNQGYGDGVVDHHLEAIGVVAWTHVLAPVLQNFFFFATDAPDR
jgi:hypothetical protein